MQTAEEILSKHIGTRIYGILDGGYNIPKIVAAMREYASLQSGQQGMRWVKASERMPLIKSGEPYIVIFRYWIGNNKNDFNFIRVGHNTAAQLHDYVKSCRYDVEWLDESPAQQLGDERWIERGEPTNTLVLAYNEPSGEMYVLHFDRLYTYPFTHYQPLPTPPVKPVKQNR